VNVLAIDTSHPVGGAALACAGRAVAEVRFGDGTSHLAEIGRAVDELLRGGELGAANLDRIALVTGPGSFTGLRIGMSFAKGLCAGLGTDLVTISSLELLALPLLAGDPVVCAMIDARKGEVYGAVYGAGDDSGGPRARTVIAPCVRPPRAMAEEAAGHSPVFVGSGALHYRVAVEEEAPGCRIAPEETALPSAGLLAAIASGLVPLDRTDVVALEPFYVRPIDAVFKPLKPVDPHE
jgi:tRNA threonylcarbamoyladenosine biosynthesis protein TsaB